MMQAERGQGSFGVFVCQTLARCDHNVAGMGRREDPFRALPVPTIFLTTHLRMDTSNRWRPPDLASWRVFSVIVALLLGALALEIALSPHWTDPFRAFETWVLVGVGLGMACRAVGGWLARRNRPGEKTLRRLSLAVWLAAALGGLVGLLF